MSELPIAVCKAARQLLHWSQDELAHRADVNRSTVANFESGNNIRVSTEKLIDHAKSLRAALTLGGIGFVVGPKGVIGCYLRDMAAPATIRRVENPQQSVLSAI